MTMHRPRLLPATIAVMAVLLVFKSASLVWAAAGLPAVPASPQPAPAPAKASRGAVSALPVAAAQAGAAETGAPAVSDAERALLLDLRHRRAELDARAKELDQRNAVMQAANAKLTARVEQLGALQARLEALDTDRRAHDDANWTGLVHVYETMKPREAAQIFDALDMQVLLAVLDRMQPRRAAPVLAAMQPDRARLATQMLAEMRTRTITPAAPAPAANQVPAQKY